MSRLPSILRRHLRLHQARRALLRGAPEEALGILRDPCLLLSSRAEWMRSRTLELLCRAALQKSHQGRDASSARLVEMVDAEDPDRAERLRRRLSPTPPDAPAGAGEESSETLDALRKLLAELRPAEGPPAAAPEASPERRGAVEPARTAQAPAPGSHASGAPGRLARLAVDDGGESLLARGSAFVLGHLRSTRADLPFLADVEREHARLACVESFHGGTRWSLEAHGAIEVDGRTPDARGPVELTLTDGQEVRLAHNLAFRFRVPDPSSSSAVLELLHGAECLGASRVLLCVPGTGGRLRVGPGRDRHVGVGALDEDLELCFDDERLVLRCAAGLRPTVAAGDASVLELAVPWPLAVAVDLAVGRATPERPPFGVALRPVPDTRPPERGRAPDAAGADEPGGGEA